MTGVIAGSGGTGVLEGSRPGTGVTGSQAGPPTPLLIGVGQDSGTSLVTSSFTALPERAMYVAAVTTGRNTGGVQPGGVGASGMGLTWGLLGQYPYDSVGGARGMVTLLWAFGEATTGPVTVTSANWQGIGLVLFAVEDGDFPLGITPVFGNADPFIAAVPVLLPHETAIAVHGIVTNGEPSTVDPAFTVVGESPDNSQTVKTYVGFHKPIAPATNTFANTSLPSFTAGLFMFKMSALPIMPYASTIGSMDANARYPLRVKSTGPDPDPYDTEILNGLAVNALYPLQTTGVGPALLAYDTVNATMTPSTLILPGPKGAAPNPPAYDTVIPTLGPSRFVPAETIPTAAPMPAYDTYMAGLGLLRWVPADVVVDDLPTVIMALGPVGYWKLDDSGSTFVDSSGNALDGTGTAVTDRGQAGPDGADYALFVTASDSVVNIPNPGANFSLPTGPGLSVVALIRPTALTGSLQLVSRGYQTPYTEGEWAVQIGVSGTPIDAKKTNANLSSVRSTTTSAMQAVGEWRLLIVTFEDGTTTGPIKVYANGGEITSLNTTGSGASVALAGGLRIGGRPDASLSYDGAMAHVAIIPGVLDAAAIAALASAASVDGWTTPIPPPPPPTLSAAITALSPVAYFPLDDASDPAVDQGSRLVNFTTVGSPTFANLAGPDGNNYVTLPGTGDNWFTLPDAADLGIDYATGKTFVLAFAPDSVVNGLSLFCKMEVSMPRDYFYYAPPGTDEVTVIACRSDTANTYFQAETVNPVTLGQWNLMVFRVNTDGTQSCFLNSGTNDLGVPSIDRQGPRQENGSSIFCLGALDKFAGYRHDGGLAHFAMFNTALSDTDIGSIFTSGIAEGWT